MGRLQVDIADRRQAEAALRESEDHYRHTVELNPQVAWTSRPDGQLDHVSQRWMNWTGTSGLGSTWGEAVHPDDLGPSIAAWTRSVATGEPYDIEHRIRLRSGEYHWMHSRAFPRRDEQGRIVKWYGTTEDIQESKAAEEALRESEARLSALFAQASAGIVQGDLEGRFTLVNDRYCELVGRSRDELLGLCMQDITHPDDLAANMPLFAAAIGGGSAFDIEKRYVRPDGSTVWVRNSVTAVRGPDGAVESVLAVSTDITDRKNAETALRESETRFRNMADHAPVMIWTTDPSARCTYLNRSWYELTGQAPEEALGFGWLDATHPDDRPEGEAAFLAANARRAPFRLEYRLRRHDGEYRWAIDAAAPRFAEDGAFLGYIGSVIDITERKRMEERQNLLINELNHRVKNTLATVQSIAAQTLRNAPTTEAARDAFESRLLALSRAHDVLTRENWEGAGLHEIVAQAVEPYSNQCEDRLHLSGSDIRLAPRMALALAMALQELATNAAKYGALSNATGEVKIGWKINRKAAPPLLRLRWEETGGPPVLPPQRRGFGSRLIERSLAQDLGGEVRIDFAPSGVVCTIAAPLA
jgi:PAS domain S-box-containing protein